MDLKHLEKATVERIGCWLWITFEEKPEKETCEHLKENGFFFSSKKKAWYKPGPLGGRWRGSSMNDLRMRHGSELISDSEIS